MTKFAKQDWTIRKARISDAAALGQCMADAFAGPSAQLGGDPLPPMVANYEKEIQDYLIFVAHADTEIIGGLVLVPKPNHLLVGIVAVIPKAQGMGIGKALLAFAEKQSEKMRLPELRLVTHIALSDNIAFYKRLDWTKTRRTNTRVFMSKSLT